MVFSSKLAGIFQASDREMWHNCLASSAATANLAVKTLPVIPAPSFSGLSIVPSGETLFTQTAVKDSIFEAGILCVVAKFTDCFMMPLRMLVG